MKLIPSSHFKQRLAERGLSWIECEETVRNPTRKTQMGKGAQGGVRYKYERDYPDRKIIIVAGEELPKQKNVFLMTVWKQGCKQ